MESSRVHLVLMSIATACLVIAPLAEGKDKSRKLAPKDPQDAIEVIGHVTTANGPVTGFVPTQHYSSSYLYVEHAGGQNVTLVDVTKASQPVILADLAYQATAGASSSLVTVAGTAALVTDQPGPTGRSLPSQTVRIMDFSETQHPKVAREFAGVTSMSRDEKRGLIFVANGDGIWILRQTFAEDPEVQQEYDRQLLYNH